MTIHGQNHIKSHQMLRIIVFGFSLRSTDILVSVVFVETTVFLIQNRHLVGGKKKYCVPKFRYSGFH